MLQVTQVLAAQCAELEREAARLDREEAKLIAQMKESAKKSPEAAKPLAKQLVRLRQHKSKLQARHPVSWCRRANGISTA